MRWHIVSRHVKIRKVKIKLSAHVPAAGDVKGFSSDESKQYINEDT